MTWGKAIVLTFILFAGFIGSLVTVMCRQQIDLVREDYYQSEIVFQKQIERVNNATQTDMVMAMTYQPNRQQITFTLPNAHQKAVITFYRPANRQRDFRVSIGAGHPIRRVVSTARMDKGYWRVQFAWSDGQRDYYRENELFID